MENGIWINRPLATKVLTVGCKYNPPRGGIAQVLWNYDKYIFEKFKFIENSRKSNALINFFIAFGAMIKMFARLMFDNEIKIVHIHTASGISFKRSTYFLRIAKMFNKKVVMHIHGGGFKDYYNSNQRFVSCHLKSCDKIITLSQDWADFYSSIGFGSVCVENIIPEPVKLHLNKADNLVHMLYLGLIVERKGIYDLLDVLATHKAEFLGKIMLHIGGNGEIERLKEVIKSQRLEELVSFEGWVDSEKKIELMNLCDVFVLPSYVEGLPLSILEAISYDMTIISTRVGGIPSIVKDGYNGYLLNPGDKEELFLKIICILDKEKEMKTGCTTDQNDITSYYPSNVSKKLSLIYRSLLQY